MVLGGRRSSNTTFFSCFLVELLLTAAGPRRPDMARLCVLVLACAAAAAAQTYVNIECPFPGNLSYGIHCDKFIKFFFGIM